MTDPSVACPDCPECGNPPTFAFESQAFCDTKGCSTFCWERRQTPAWNRQHITWHDASTGAAMPTIICPRCGMVSADPQDIEHGYCGNCHDWTSKVST